MLRHGKLRRVPDFFIVGAPKCGTNALYSYLSEHPQVYTPRLKEPQFFCYDFPALRQLADAEAYKDLFAGAPKGKLTGEGSVWYMYSRVAIRTIMELNPRAKIIALLRNPVDAAYSLHSQFVRGFKENVGFEDAWNLQAARRCGYNLPRYCPEPRCLQYRRVYSFAGQVRRLRQLVPSEQLRVYISEEWFAEPHSHYQDVLRFLDLPDDGRTHFPVRNENRMPRTRAVGRIVANIPWPITRHYGTIRACLRPLGIRPRHFIATVTSAPAPRVPLRPELRGHLAAAFAPDIAELERLIGRPLDIWNAASEVPLTTRPVAGGPG